MKDHKDIKIMIVEDDPIIATDIKSLLRKEGFQVVGHAKNASIAFDMIKSTRPEFIILDIHLGTGSSGIDIAEHLHEHYKIPYIFLTSFSDPVTLAAAQEQGPYGYLVKPFQDKTLLTTIAIAWSNYQRIQDFYLNDFDSIGSDLTNKEKEVAQYLLEGLSYQQICDKIFLSINTVKYHVKNIYLKLNISSRAELTALFLKK